MHKNALVMFLFLIIATFANSEPAIPIVYGLIEGTWKESYNGRQFTAFEGIPYAQAPVNDRRFEPPYEAYYWKEVLKANQTRTCLQSYFENDILKVIGEEDCLYLNVYVPRENPNSSENLNVIVHFHGGGFQTGSGHQYAGPKYLMDTEVILVTVNYRLGPFGFLSTEDEVCPGNNGMKDQVQSLKWIQKNIKFFGGNPDSVTLTGMSAGGASVHLHYFSPLSKGLFHRGFSEGGTALNPWALQKKAYERAVLLGKLTGCGTHTTQRLITCLKDKPGNDIVRVLPEFSPVMGSPSCPFAPVIEYEHDGAFLIQQPYQMLRDKAVVDLPWIAAVSEQEGSLFALTLEEAIPEIERNFEIYAPYLLEYNDTIDESQKLPISNHIREYYFKESFNVESFAKLIQDRLFFSAADTAAKLQAEANKSPVYFYILGYKGEHSFGDTYLNLNTESIGASHGDSVFYYLNSPLASQNLRKDDAKMMSIFTQWITSFANNEEPKVPCANWKPVDNQDTLQYLSIKSPRKLCLRKVEDFGSTGFWNGIPFKENEYLLPT